MSAQIFPIVGAAPLVLPDPLPTQDVSDGTPGAATPDTAIQVAGTDGTNLQTILTDTSGRQEVVGAAASGVAVTGNPVLVAGQDGTDARTLLTDSAGREVIVGAAAPGAVPAGNPVLVSGQDGTDVRTLLTDNTGQLKVLVEGGTGIPVTGTVTAQIEGHAGGVLDAVVGAAIPANAILVGGSESGNIEPLLLDGSGFLKVNVAAGSSGNAAASPTGSAVPADADYLGASDGTNLIGLLVESTGNPNLRVGLFNGTYEAAVDAQGGVKVAGEAASGAAVTGNPVLVAGQDGTDARTLLTDNTGQLKVLVENGSAIAVSGTVTAEIVGNAGGVLDAVVGAAIPANAVLIGGSEAGNIEPLLLDASGFLKVNVAAGSAGNAAASATGSAVPADADYLGASDGTDLQGLLVESATHPNLRVALYNGAVEAVVDAQGGVKVSGEAASGSAVTGNPVLVAGQDGTDARTLLTDNNGQLKILVENASAIATTDKADGTPGSAVPTTALQVAGTDGTDLRTLLTDNTGQLKILVENASAIATTDKADGTPGSAVPTTALQVAGTDGTDLRTLLTDNTGQLKTVADVAQASTTSGQVGPLVQMATVTSAPTDTSAKTNPLRGDAAGNLRVNPFGNTGSFITTVTSATGSNPTYTVPTGYKLLLKALNLGIGTSSTAATRAVQVTILTSAGAGIWLGAQFSAAASIAANLFSTPVPILFTTPGAISNGSQNWTPLPPELTLGPGTTISYSVTNIQTADAFKLTVCGMLLPD